MNPSPRMIAAPSQWKKPHEAKEAQAAPASELLIMQHEYAEILPAGTKLRMTSDRILLKPLDVKWSDRIIVARRGRPVRGEVISIGPGHYPLKYKAGPNGPRSIVEYSRHFRRTELRVGDIVELGGLNVFDGEGYQFPQVVIGTERLLIVTERDVAGVLDARAA